MKGLFKSSRSNGAPPPSPITAMPKKDPQAPHKSPLEMRMQDMGPIRGDGSDKFFGMENYGNTCYCNSILQCLYYSVPFREAVINYPQRTPLETLETALATNLRYQNPNAFFEAEALAAKQKPAPMSSSARQAGVAPSQPQKPEDKESAEYKKKVALQTLPILETTNNANSYGMSESIFTSLKDIFESLVGSQSRIGVIRPQQFLDVLRREHEMFRTAMHQDAHEFLNLLLNEVVSNVEAEATKQGFPEKALPPTDSADSLGMVNSSTGSKSPNTTRWVHELFEGLLTSETKCLTCEKASQRDEIFLDLSVDLEQHSSVTSCLRKFSAEEMLCERNKFHCDNCGGLQEAEKRMKIKRLPRVLALHLKRFKYTEDLQRLQKLFHRVVYPYYLRLFNTTDDAEDPDRLYELYAVVVHIGGGPYHGHYVAIIKTEDRGWLLFDDELVEPVDKSYVRNFFGDKPGLACAYVLFYQETTLEAMMKEQAEENQTSTGPHETAEATKSNGHPLSPVTQVHSASYPSEDHHRFTPVDRFHTAPQMTPQLETPEHEFSSPSQPVPAQPAQSPQQSQPSNPTLPPISDEPTPILGTKKSESILKKDRLREEKERKAQEKALEKERERQERNRRKEFDHQRIKEELDFKRAIEASRMSTPKPEVNDIGPENGSPRKSLNFLKRGSRSIGHRLSNHKDLRVSTTDFEPLPASVPEPHSDAPVNGTEPARPPVPLKEPDISSPMSPRVHNTPFPRVQHAATTKDHTDPEQKNGHHHHLHIHHPRWRSFSFKKGAPT